MKFPVSMLHDYVQTSLTPEALGDLLTMAGFELEGIEQVDGEAVLDIKVVSNRGDGLSVFGLAREVLAKDSSSSPTDLYKQAVAGFESEQQRDFELQSAAATVEAPECHRFACRAFTGVDSIGTSPEWMQQRLHRAGMRPISILVDLTNYVMLELGQPLHAFDRDKLAGRAIVVRHARPGEKLTTLNGVEHELHGQMMICDTEKPVGVPGVMGGLETEVTDATTHLLLESANFLNTNVRKTRKQLGLNTEASYRFERSVDPDGVVRAIHRFTALLLESQPDVTVSNIVDHYPGRKNPATLKLRLSRTVKLLGMPVTQVEALRYLTNLGFQASLDTEGVIDVLVPSWRPDIVREDDLVEEIGRVHGYELIPEELPIGHTPVGGPQGMLLRQDLLREALVRTGYIQIISHSLRDRHPLDSPGEAIGPKNPASPEMAWLRSSLLPSLADASVRNGGKDLHLFEIGTVFSRQNGGILEQKKLGILSVGFLYPASWQKGDIPASDFFSLKGALLSAFDQVGIEAKFRPLETQDARFHPTRCASISVDGAQIGVMGQIHPNLAESIGVNPDAYLAELDVTALTATHEIAYRPISRNPAVRRDISFEVAKTTPFQEIEQSIVSSCGDVLERHWLFDVYEGKGIEEGNRSLSVALQLRKPGENFTDEEANQVRERAVEGLVALGAKPR